MLSAKRLPKSIKAVKISSMYLREQTQKLYLGNVAVGGGSPITVQSMTKTPTRDIEATVKQIQDLAFSGCEIVRVAVPDMESALSLKEICLRSPIPVVADIHFDYRLALIAAKFVAGLRINPGNIGADDRVKAVVEAAKEYNLPIRIGVNSGSLPKGLDPQLSLGQRMAQTALQEIARLQKYDFQKIKISVKAFDIEQTRQAYTILAKSTPYPMHIGITEAGTSYSGLVRSCVGIGSILSQGIGDTIRVSLSAPPVEEVRAGWEILKSLNLRRKGVSVIACPTCARAQANIPALALAAEEALREVEKPLTVAVMGCAVNGPGEASSADLGLACGAGHGVLFRRGEKIGEVDEKNYLQALLEQVSLW